MATYTLEQAEETDEFMGYTWFTALARPGDTVDLGHGWMATVTQAGLDCDCGKEIYCPLNPQERK